MNGTLPNDGIAFTWSPDPKKFSFIDPVKQFNDTLPFIRLLDTCGLHFTYPELNASGNIHYHSKIFISDKVKWFKSVLPKFKYNGMVKIKTKNIDEGWDKYLIKDKEVMEKILNITLPIINLPKVKKTRQIQELCIEEQCALDYGLNFFREY